MCNGIPGDVKKRCATRVCGERVVIESNPPDRATIEEYLMVDGYRPPLVCRMVVMGKEGEGVKGGRD